MIKYNSSYMEGWLENERFSDRTYLLAQIKKLLISSLKQVLSKKKIPNSDNGPKG